MTLNASAARRHGKRLIPYSRDSLVAEIASIPRQVVGGNGVSPALDQQFLTLVTVSVIAFVVRYIAYIGVMNTLLQG